MGERTEELKLVAQLRKAVMPLVTVLKQEADQELAKRLDTLEESLEALTKRDTVVNVAPPEVTVHVKTDAIITALEKQNQALLRKIAPPVASSPAYEPHDQVKKGTFQYSGFVSQSGDWYIQRVAKGEQRYAKGKSGYAEAWDNIDSLKFGYLDG